MIKTVVLVLVGILLATYVPSIPAAIHQYIK